MQHNLSRRKFLQVTGSALASAMALAGLSGCRPDRPLKIASQVWPGYSFMYLAQQLGLWGDQSIELLETANLAQSSEALLTGTVHGAALTLDEVLYLIERGVGLRVVLVFDRSAGADGVMAKPDIIDAKQLLGKTIGLERSTLARIIVKQLLATAQLTVDQVRLQNIEFDHLKAWENEHGKLDAIVTYAPNIEYFEQKGLHKIFDSRQLPGLIVDVLAFRREALETHNASITALLDSHFRAQELWRSNPYDTSFLLGNILKISPHEVREAFEGLDLPDSEFNRHLLRLPNLELRNACEEIVKVMRDANLMQRTPAIQDIFVEGFLP